MQRTAALESSVCPLRGPASPYVHERQSCFSQAALAAFPQQATAENKDAMSLA